MIRRTALGHEVYWRAIAEALNEMVTHRLAGRPVSYDVRVNDLVDRWEEGSTDRLLGPYVGESTGRLIEDFELGFCRGVLEDYVLCQLDAGDDFRNGIELAASPANAAIDFGEDVPLIARAAGLSWALSKPQEDIAEFQSYDAYLDRDYLTHESHASIERTEPSK